jgi:Flp pilus assembly protein TadG
MRLSNSPGSEKTRGTGNRRGQSLVEFSLVMPVLFLTVTGMLSFGLSLHDDLVLTNGVNSAAQVLSISRGQTTDPCATAVSAVQNASPSLVNANLSYTFVLNGASFTSTSCTSGAADMVQGASAQITAAYPCVLAIYSMHIPGCNLRAQTTEVIQ